MLENKLSYQSLPAKSITPSKWIGFIFGFWLSGVFSAMLFGNLLSSSRSSITQTHQDNSFTIALLLFSVAWPIPYFLFSRARQVPIKINLSCSIAIYIFIFFSMMSLFFSTIKLISTSYWLLTIVSIWLSLQFIKLLDTKQLERGFKAYAFIIFCLLAGFTSWEYTPGIRLGETHRIFEPAMIGLIAMSALTSSMSYRNKLLRYSFVFGLLVVIYLTGSRAPLLGALIGLITIQFERTRSSAIMGKTLALLFVLASAVLFIVFFNEIWPYIDNYLGLHDKLRGIESGGSGRTMIWGEVWNLFLNHPAFGVGFRAHEPLLKIGSSAHNGYLALLAEIGLFGFLAIIFIAISGFFRLRRLMKHDKSLTFTYSILLGTCTSYLFLAMFERYLINCGNPTSLLFIISILWTSVNSKSSHIKTLQT